jgi:hypothetical protein
MATGQLKATLKGARGFYFEALIREELVQQVQDVWIVVYHEHARHKRYVAWRVPTDRWRWQRRAPA